MCIAVPVKVLEINGEYAMVDYGGLQKRISLALVTGVSVGDYLVVHAGAAIQRIDPEEARETLALMEQLLDE